MDRADRILEKILRPGELRKCASGESLSKERAIDPELAAEQLMAKYDFDAKIQALGLSNYDVAELGGVTECHVRAWRDPRDMKRHPPSHAVRRLQKLLEARATIGGVKGVGK